MRFRHHRRHNRVKHVRDEGRNETAVRVVERLTTRRRSRGGGMGSDMGLVGSRRAALFALMAVLAHVTINYVPLEYVVAAQQSAFATGTRLSPEEAVDAAVVLGYSVEAGTPTLPLVARVHLGVRLFCAGAARNIVFSGCALHPAPALTAPPKRLPERASHLSPLPPGKTLTRDPSLPICPQRRRRGRRRVHHRGERHAQARRVAHPGEPFPRRGRPVRSSRHPAWPAPPRRTARRWRIPWSRGDDR